jgi:hypothetical protein
VTSEYRTALAATIDPQAFLDAAGEANMNCTKNRAGRMLATTTQRVLRAYQAADRVGVLLGL